MTRMVTAVDNIRISLERSGFRKEKHSIYLRDTSEKDVLHWAAVSEQGQTSLVTIGAIAPSINKFALGLLRKCSEGRIKPQYPAYLIPPIIITSSMSLEKRDTIQITNQLVADFDSKFFDYKIYDWFELASKMAPNGPAQNIILPAYYYIKNNRKKLIDYIDNKNEPNITHDVSVYYKKLRSLADSI